jgi:hypothetical protein
MASATGREGRPVHGVEGTSWLGKVFELNPAAINWPRAVMILDVMLVPLVVFWAIGHEEYLLSAIFGVLFTALADPGGSYGYRVSHTAVFGLIGAGLTALGFGIGGDAWGWLVLAAGVVTLVAGLAAMFGVHRFVTAYLLNVWFIIALVVASGLHHAAQNASYLARPSASLQLCRRGLPDPVDAVRGGDRGARHVPRRSARQAHRQSAAATSRSASLNVFRQRRLKAVRASARPNCNAPISLAR